MPWVVGLDEAGYGPNLGPLVQTAVAAWLPDDDPAGWSTLSKLVHRSTDKAEGRVLVDDSKEVNTGKHGFRKLEQGLSAMLGPFSGTLGEWLNQHALDGVVNDLQAESWYDSAETLPLFPKAKDLRAELEKLGVKFHIVGVKLVPAPLFNKIVDGSNSKATVLTIGLIALLMKIRRVLNDLEPVQVFCDKQGGRNYYAAAVQAAFPEGWVVTELESANESRYRVESLGRTMKVLFQPRAEAASVSVAVASMLAKYLRELTMKQFNAFWAKQVKDLKPTAGYPQDAKRFMQEISEARETLGISEDAIWRSR